MFVRTVLGYKGSNVIAVQDSDGVKEVASILTRWRIGAVLVRDSAGEIAGILSERDVVAGIAQHGEACLGLTAREIMARQVVTCAPDDAIDDIMVLMTERRIRHLPVMEDGRLVGLISIGDVVKSRIAEIQTETDALRSYITAG